MSAVMAERRRLINLAYRMLGSLADAEDAVQETYARWYAMSAAQQEAIESPGAWLTTAASRICLDLLGSARARRERYVGEWIPEPLPEPGEWASVGSGGSADPADRVTLDESVGMAFGRIRAAQPPPSPPARQAGLVRDFKQAWEAKDIEALVGLLDPGATVVADGGGLVTAALHPIEGREQVARYLADIAGRVPGGLTILERTVNGQPGLVAQQDGVTVTVFAFEVAGDKITHIWAVRNPDKLRPWTTG
jgi:RNA polymerase sigma-70 factor (ECF subfamily)